MSHNTAQSNAQFNLFDGAPCEGHAWTDNTFVTSNTLECAGP